MKSSIGSKVVVMIGLVIIAGMAAWLTNIALKNQAIDKCYEHSLVRWQSNEGGQGTNFVPEWFKDCLQRKSIKA